MSAVTVGIGVVVFVVLVVMIALLSAPTLKGKRVNGAWESYIYLESSDSRRPQTIYVPIYVAWDGTIYQNGAVYARITGDKVVSIANTAPQYTVNGVATLATFVSGTVNSSVVNLTSNSLTDVSVEGMSFRWEWTR